MLIEDKEGKYSLQKKTSSSEYMTEKEDTFRRLPPLPYILNNVRYVISRRFTTGLSVQNAEGKIFPWPHTVLQVE